MDFEKQPIIIQPIRVNWENSVEQLLRIVSSSLTSATRARPKANQSKMYSLIKLLYNGVIYGQKNRIACKKF